MKGFWEFELSIRARLQRNPLLYYVLDVVLKFFFSRIFYSSYLKVSVSWSTFAGPTRLEILELTDWFKYILFFSLIHRDSNTTSKQPFICKKRKGNWYFMHEIATENLLTSVFDTLMWRKWLGRRKVCEWSSKFSILASKEVLVINWRINFTILRFYDLRSEKVLVEFLQSELWPHISEELPSFFLRSRKLSHQELLVQNPLLLWAQIMSVSL